MSGKKVNIAQGGMRSEAKKSKVVFKNVLDTPFNIQWPEVTADNNTIILDTVCEMVKPIREYHNTRPKQDVKSSRKSSKSSGKESGESKPSTSLATVTSPTINAASVALEPHSETTSISPPPPIVKSTILGINAVTKALERSIQDLATHPPPVAVILCKGDLIPSHLYAHLGPMIAMLPKVLLFPLLKGSERRLSEALGLPAVGALAIQSTEGSREAEGLVMLLKGMVDPMTASWLPKIAPKPVEKNKTPSQPSTKESTGAAPVAEASAPTTVDEKATSKITSKKTEFIPTNIKTIKTTMPIVVKTPKASKLNASDNSSNINNNKSKGQQQQKQQKQQHQQQPHSRQDKNKQPPIDRLDSDRGTGKKARSS